MDTDPNEVANSAVAYIVSYLGNMASNVYRIHKYAYMNICAL